ncbi:MAG: peptidase pyroglutamyl peptidase [Tardiphaga sp.]|nr:peptidase pyroglutamyl peptidase [Tardiphaga sp.]
MTLRILVTGFGPFPGASYNPTPELVRRLAALRRPAFAEVTLIPYVFDVSYGAVDRDLPRLLAAHRPNALLMFGLAQRTRHVRVETRARNAVTQLWPDAAHTRVRKRAIVSDSAALTFGPHTSRLLRVALGTGVDARLSRDAGSYLCNYLSWRGIEATCRDGGPAVAAFIHVPLVARPGVSRLAGRPRRITMDELVDTGEAILLEIVAQTRRAAFA